MPVYIIKVNMYLYSYIYIVYLKYDLVAVNTDRPMYVMKKVELFVAGSLLEPSPGDLSACIPLRW